MKKLIKKTKLQENIDALDLEIGVLTQELIDAQGDEYDKVSSKIGALTEIRASLANDKVNGSYSRDIISGAVALAGLVLVLKHEKAEIITTKAFSIATKLIRG